MKGAAAVIEVGFFRGVPVAVLGLGKSGLAAAGALHKGGAEVWAWDDDENKRAAAQRAGISIVDLRACDWSKLSTLVISPGIPHTHPAPHPVALLAKQHGCDLVGDIELLGRSQPFATYVGVTGTNGKSTTTALIGHILETSAWPVQVGGNLGPPALMLAPMGSTGTYVLEMSSYQLELMRSITFQVAVLLNISADHLDRHGSLDGYIQAKRLIFRNQTRSRTAVVGVDDEASRRTYDELVGAQAQKIIPISASTRTKGGVYVDEGVLCDDLDGREVRVIDLRQIRNLPGEHNWQNAAAAYAACRSQGIGAPVISAGIRSFHGLAHRQELVATINGIDYINDSKATNADAAAKALACYDVLYWIAGGRPKEGGIESLSPYFPRIVHAYLIGEAQDAFAQTLDGRVAYSRCDNLREAVAQAHASAQADHRTGAVVLLSPACASFDQFANFEERGEVFRTAVHALQDPGMEPASNARVLQ